MSVVAWDGEMLAADKQATTGDSAVTVTKLFEVFTGGGPDQPLTKYVVAFTGHAAQMIPLLHWFASGANPDAWPKFQSEDDWTRMLVLHPGTRQVQMYERWPHPVVIEDVPCAWGSGRDVALGAMLAGADAREAVEITAAVNVYCGRGVDVFDCAEPAPSE